MELNSFIKSYLEIPVVLGLGLCRATVMRPAYFNSQVHHDPRQHEIFSQIRNKILTFPSDSDFYEGTILDYYLYLHKLDEHNKLMTLLIHENNVVKSFRAPQLIQKLMTDFDEGKKLFEELATQKTISGQPIDQGLEEPQSLDAVLSSSENSSLEDVSLQEILSALNALSQFAKKYIGPKIVSNYWQLSRPKHEWLRKFEIRYSAAIRFNGENSDHITPLQVLIIREWTQNFMKKCHTIIQDLPKRFEEEGMPEKSRKILSIYTSEYLKYQKNVKETSSESLFGDVFS